MLRRSTHRTCFIIGPMKDADLRERARLRKLKTHVVAPLLAEIGGRDGVKYDVLTPYDQTGGLIINDVINGIDRADIVVADLTDNNPNVFYELSITHALGRPCVAVVEERLKKLRNGQLRRAELPFDIKAYRAQYINLDEDQFTEAREVMRPFLERAHRESDWRKLENPVIDFYRAPLTFISPAFALAQGYYHNFVKPVVEALIRRDSGEAYTHRIVTGTAATPNPQRPEEAQLLPDDQRARLNVYIIVPTRIHLAKHNYVDKMKGQPNLYSAFVGSMGRPYTCFMQVSDGAAPALIDVPTTIRGMEDAVKRRLRTQFTSTDDPEYREFEAQEIERFVVMLDSFIAEHEFGPEFIDRVKILTYDPAQPQDLLWFHNILQQR